MEGKIEGVLNKSLRGERIKRRIKKLLFFFGVCLCALSISGATLIGLLIYSGFLVF